MRTKPLLLFSAMLAGFAYLLTFGGCSEDNPAGDVDQAPPLVTIVTPIATSVYGATIVDSIDVIIRAEDNAAVRKIDLFTIFHADTSARRLGTMTQPDSGSYYSFHWKTLNVTNGSSGQLYAVAEDMQGNQAASGRVAIRVINTKDIGPAQAAFSISPSEGTVETQFIFDASSTSDALNEPIDILARWDFEGDGVWDIDTTADVKASDEIRHIYSVPDTYQVVLEVFNDYFSLETGIPGRTTRELVVKPATGIPDPQEGEQFVEIAAGTYPFGALACPPGESCGSTDTDETLADTLYVRITNAYFISKYEVTNELFLNYLNGAFDDGSLISFDEVTGEVRSQVDGRLLLLLDEDLTRVKYRFVDSTFWVEESYLQHPMVGVTWYGASAYAAYYGLRLPSEAEWEVAARAGFIAPGHIYPWVPQQTIDGTLANYYNSGDPAESTSDPLQTMPVGSYSAAGPFGTYDQAGNAAEWVKDWYSDQTYGGLYASFSSSGNRPPLDPQGPTREESSGQKVIRGGGYNQWPWDVRLTNRQAWAPGVPAGWVGFRTAYIEF